MNNNLKNDKLFQAVCLVTGQLLMTASTFFWNDHGRYTVNGAVIIIFAMVFWMVGFTGLFDLVKEKSPWYSRLGLLYAMYGCVGGIAFGFEGLYSAIFEVSDKIGVSAHENFPLQMNLVLFWSGPAFPLTMILLGTVLAVKRIGNIWVNILFIVGGIAFPVSRISRIGWAAMIADVLLLIPVVVTSLYIIKEYSQNEKKLAL